MRRIKRSEKYKRYIYTIRRGDEILYIGKDDSKTGGRIK